MTLLRVLDLNQGSSPYEDDEMGRTSPTRIKLVVLHGNAPYSYANLAIKCFIRAPAFFKLQDHSNLTRINIAGSHKMSMRNSIFV